MKNKLDYDVEKDYMELMQDAAERGDLESAGEYERLRNAKIDGEGLKYNKTYDYQTTPQNKEPFSYSSAPQYVSQWQDVIDQATKSILNRGAFTYDHTTDPLYQQMEKTYTEKGQKAMEDTLGIVSQRTGGLASSYAAQAGQQSYNQYMDALADKIPELRQLAYQMYQDEGDRMMDNLSLLTSMEERDYGRYLDTYGQYLDEQNRIWDEKNRDYDRTQDAKNAAMTKAETLAQYGDFSGYKALGYSDAEIAAMEQAWQEGGTAEYKPTLTWAQVKAEVEAGNASPAVLEAYEYYMGEPYEPTYDATGYDEDPVPTGSGGYTASEWSYVLNNIKTNLREGNVQNVDDYLDQIADGLSAEQWSEIQKLLEEYGV